MACGLKCVKKQDKEKVICYSSLPRGANVLKDGGFTLNIAVAVLGATKVGKTWLVQRLIGNNGPLNVAYRPTSEDVYRHSISFRGGTVNLEIFDTAGAYEFPVMQKLAIESADAFMLVYSVANRDSLEVVKQLHEDITYLKDNAPVVIVGTKTDMPREVSCKEVEHIATQEWMCSFVETSAKCQVNINTVTQRLLRELELKRHDNKTIDRSTYNQRGTLDINTPSAIIIRRKSTCSLL